MDFYFTELTETLLPVKIYLKTLRTREGLTYITNGQIEQLIHDGKTSELLKTTLFF